MSARVQHDAGYTLVELLIYVSLFGVVLAVVGAMLTSTLNGQRTVTNATTSTSAAQIVADGVNDAVRSSSAMALTAPSAGAQLLVVQSTDKASGSLYCKAWYFTSTAPGRIYSLTKRPASIIAAPTAATLATWTPEATDISAVTGNQIFSLAGKQVTLAMSLRPPKAAPVLIKTSVLSRGVSITGSSSCF